MSASRIAPYCRSVRGETMLRALAERPGAAALLLDADGVLAPIVQRPEDARVPDDTRALLERLVPRYELVACISGRTGADAARVVGVDGIVYVGSHGLELEPDAEAWRERLRAFGASVDWPVEDKGLTVSFHYRGADNEPAARLYLEEVASHAKATGLVARFGRKVLELRPPLAADKGTAVGRLLADRPVTRALYAGDDTTDLDAFRGLRAASLDVALCIAVASSEGPRELREQADLVVGSPAELAALLDRL
jgi:trehalose 6-phosphate phosphatase